MSKPLNLAEIPIEDLGLRHSTYKSIKELGAYTALDIFYLPEETLVRFYPVLLEGLERVKRNHMAPY